MLDKIARARARARAHVWELIQASPAGFPWLVIAGKTLAGWLVIDMDATLVTASSRRKGQLPPGKRLRLPPTGRLARQYPRTPGHAAAAGLRNRILVRVDGASHELIAHLLSMSSARRIVLFTCGWMITAADEDAIRQVPAGAWKPGTGQDGTAEIYTSSSLATHRA
jgi:hypothetical protein